MASFAFKKKLLSSVVAAGMIAGFAASGNVSAVHVSEDNVGQVLLAPYYNVNNGWKTQVAVVNTRTDAAVKVKIVLRSRAHSTEVLDFYCYMTPGDVCRFDVVNINGQANMFSNDDSVRSVYNPVTFASQQAITQPLFDDRMLQVDSNDTNEEGHIEIIGAYAVTVGTVTTPSGVVTVKRAMSKHELVKIFDAPRTSLIAGPGVTITSIDPALVRLTGDVQLVKTGNSDRMGYSIPALDGSVGDMPGTDPRTALPFDGRVIANSVFDVTIAQETAIGNGFGIGGSDNIYELETALASATLAGTYEDDRSAATAGVNRTNLVVTFPTKYRHRVNHICTNMAPTVAEVAGALYTSPFRSNGTVPYQLLAFDNQENSVETGDIFSGGAVVQRFLFAEVNYFMPEWPAAYTSGWYSLALVPSTTNGDVCGYPGLPVLGMSHKYFEASGVANGSLLTEAAKP